MNVSRRNFLKISSLAAAALSLGGCSVVGREIADNNIPDTLETDFVPDGLNDPVVDPVWRLLNRGGYGPRPGDYQRATSMGLEGYLEEQLHPEQIDGQDVEIMMERLSLYDLEIERLFTRDRREVVRQLMFATLIRSLYSRRQLYEAMVEFWSDHFNIYLGKNKFMPYLKLVDDRDVIRPHALGKFRDLLNGSVRSPAMLVYLDNVQNARAEPNENYARELMELHTLGVDGGYTQKDVQEVARALTGWGIYPRGRRQGRFAFHEDQHDFEQKITLGRSLPAGQGEEDVEQVIDILLNHPSTAHFIAFKLVRRFVADDPSESLVRHVAQIFTETDGDIKQMLHAIFLSDEFASAPPKLKRPYTFMMSALRALHANVTGGGQRSMMDWLSKLGQLPYQWGPPDGFPDVSSKLVSNLLPRWNFGIGMVHGWWEGLEMPLENLVEHANVKTIEDAVNMFSNLTLGRRLNITELNAMLAYIGDGTVDDQPTRQRIADVIGVMLCSPGFQWM